MADEELARQYECRAKAERDAGGRVEVNHCANYVAITLSDSSEYFFQGAEADNLLSDVPEWIFVDDYLLAIAQTW